MVTRKQKVLLFSGFLTIVFLLLLLAAVYYERYHVLNRDKLQDFITLWLFNDPTLEENTDLKSFLTVNVKREFQALERIINDTRNKTDIQKDIFTNPTYHYWDIPQRQVRVDPLKAKLFNAEGMTSVDSTVYSYFATYFISHELKLKEKATFDEYTTSFLQTLSTPNDNLSATHLKVLKPFRVYLVDIKTKTIGIYPMFASDYAERLFHAESRPWWKASLKETTFPSAFRSKSESYGLTYTYEDVENNVDVLLVRTFWYRFTANVNNKEYLLCLDFIISPASEINMAGLDIRWPSVTYLLMIPMVGTIVVAMICMALVRVKRIRARVRKSILQPFLIRKKFKYWTPKMIRKDRQNVKKAGGRFQLTATVTASESKTVTHEFHNEWRVLAGAKSMGVEMSDGITESNIRSYQNELTYHLHKGFSLDIRESRFIRAVEIWKLVDEDKKDVALFEVTWQNTVAKRGEDIKIDLIFWDENKNEKKHKYLDNVIDQLQSHIAKSEGPLLDILVDMNEQPDEAIPKIVASTKVYNKFMSESKDLSKRKVEVRDLVDFSELYQYEVYAICNIHFLRFLRKCTNYKHILEFNVMRRIFVESTENEFKNFYSQLTDESEFKRYLQKNLRVLLYNPGNTNIIRKHDFAIIKKERETQYVIFNYDDDSEDAGWLSWREVDKDYYSELYDVIEAAGPVTLAHMDLDDPVSDNGFR